MKQHRELSLWLITLVGCTGALSVACGDDLGSIGDMGSAGSATTAGTGGSAAGSGGSATTMGGGGASVAGSAAVAGAGAGGMSGGAGGASAGAGGMSGGAAGMSGMGGSVNGGAAGMGGGTGLGPFGITSCQPKFEQACKPPIIFTNGDPTDKGKVFTDAVPDVTTAEQEIACTACSILYRDPSEIPNNKHPSQIKIVLDFHGGVAQAGGDQIQFDLDYINSYKGRSPDVIKQEMLGVLQHETVHLYQNYGNGGTGEGLADLVRARTGYYPKSRFRKGEGTWKDAYTASGNFYSWLTGPCSYHSTFYPQHDLDLPYKINKMLAGKSGDAAYDAVATLLQTTFGKGPDELWTEYQNTAF
jgi:hypothetical protein